MPITTAALYDFFIDTLFSCSSSLLSRSDDDIEYEVLENFSVGCISFLHAESLSRLVAADHIDEHVAGMAAQLQALALSIPQDDWELGRIKTAPVWKQVMKLSDEILERAGADQSTPGS